MRTIKGLKKQILKKLEYSPITNKIELEFEKLTHNVILFQTKYSSLITILLNLKESEDFHKRGRLAEILNDLNILNIRIQNNISKIKEFVKSNNQLSKEETKNTNLSLGDLLTNYEITISKYRTFVKKYNYKALLKMDEALEIFTNSIADLNDLICDFNLNAEFKLLQPSKNPKLQKLFTTWDLKL